MKSIREGGVYFLESPFHSEDVDAEQEKRLAYLVGTVSGRPVVVTRGPKYWDSFKTVEIIPAMRKGYPAYELMLEDRYGYLAETKYPFVPHLAHTVPIARLGYHIGSLDERELRTLIYAHQWISSPFMQADTTKYPVPAIYEELVRAKTPIHKWKENEPRVDMRLNVDHEGVIHSTTTPELDGFPLAAAKRKVSIMRETDEAIAGEGTYIPASNDNPKNAARACNTVPVQKSFPPSFFDTETLHRVASNFDISEAYYTNLTPRSSRCLTQEEIDAIRGELPIFDFNVLLNNFYDKFTTLDAYILGPRLPSLVLKSLTNLSSKEVGALKRLCNFMRDMQEDEYQRRMTVVADTGDGSAEPAVATPAQSTIDPKDRERVRQWMNRKSIMSMPNDVAAIFMRLPKGIVRGMWSGPQFKNNYDKALAYYGRKLKKEEAQ